MRIRALLTLTLLTVAGIACDDADPPKRDASPDARRDGGTDARDGATSDRGPDSMASDAESDAIPPDGSVDVPVDTAPSPDTQAPDRAPDTAPQPDTAPPDLSPDTSPDLQPDTSPDLMPDTAPLSPDLGADINPVAEQPPLSLNGCTMVEQFEDVTDEPIFPFDWIIENDEPRCFKVKFGNLLRWVVDPASAGLTFATHPVEQFPVDPTSKIEGKNTADDEDYDVVFDRTVGTFGFRCTAHPNDMRGAVWVVP